MNSELDKLYAQRMNAISEIEDTPADGEIIFDVENRTVNSSGVQDVVVQNDNICRTIKFRMRRYFEEVDRSTKSVSIRYTNPLGESDESFGSSRITGTDYITFTWVISNKATSASGELQFDILFYDDNGYSWYTKPAILIVEKGLKVTTITPKPSQDWIDSWRSEAGQYLFDYQRLENSVNNAIDILETSLPAITTAVEQCEIAVASVEQLKQETETNANLSAQNATESSLDVERATSQADRAQRIADNMESEIVEVALKSELPIQGTKGILYIVYGDLKGSNGSYRWSGVEYDPVSREVDYASVEDAKLGVDNTKVMTPLTTAAAIGGATSVAWTDIEDKPSAYPPSTHDHNGSYYTKEESDAQNAQTMNKVGVFDGTGTLNDATQVNHWYEINLAVGVGGLPQGVARGYNNSALYIFGQNATAFTQMLFCRNNSTIYKRGFTQRDVPQWTSWEVLTTATPPQEYDLLYAAGWGRNGGYAASLYKTQDETVTINGNLTCTINATDTMPIFTLPVKHMPKATVTVLAKIIYNDYLKEDVIVAFENGGTVRLLNATKQLPVISLLFSTTSFIADH